MRYWEIHPVGVQPDDTFYILGREQANTVLLTSPDDWGTVAKVDNYPAADTTTVTLRDARQFDLRWSERVWVKRTTANCEDRHVH